MDVAYVHMSETQTLSAPQPTVSQFRLVNSIIMLQYYSYSAVVVVGAKVML